MIAVLSFLLAFSVFAGAFIHEAKWERPAVEVCWITPAQYKAHASLLMEKHDPYPVLESAEIRKIIETQITGEFTPSRTGVHFTGWKPCKVVKKNSRPQFDADAGVLLLSTQDHFVGGQASIRCKYDPLTRGCTGGRAPGFPIFTLELPKDAEAKLDQPALDFTGEAFRFTLADKIRSTSTHEVGHLAGLKHENEAFYETIWEDPHCTSTDIPQIYENDQFITRNQGKPVDPEMMYYTRGLRRSHYDSNSIMNYCELVQSARNGRSFHATPVESQMGHLGAIYDQLYQNLETSQIVRLSEDSLAILTPDPSLEHPSRVKVDVRIGLSRADQSLLRQEYANTR